MHTPRNPAALLSLATLAALGLAVPPAQAQTSLVQNGGFEAAGTADAALTNGSTGIPSWTVVGQGSQSVALLHNGDYGLSSPYGAQFVDLTGYSDSTPYAGLTQTLPTAAGATYTLTFSLGADQAAGGYAGPVAATASAGNATQTFTFTPAAGATGNVFQAFTMNFTASGASTPLTITGAVSTGGQYIGLDNVSVVVAPAPEPSQAAALGLGVSGLAALALRARRRARA